MKIAIIGSGISGLTSAYLLSRKHDVHVLEANDYIGGHTHTLDVEVASGRYAIDTGFIVFNDWTYLNFIKLMNELGVLSQATAMSFSVKSEKSGLEYNGTNMNGLFAQRLNLFKPRFHQMIRDILRFNRESVMELDRPGGMEVSLGSYLEAHGYSDQFREDYIIPMGAAIWSSSVAQMLEFPLEYFVRFFKNHGMLSVDDRPTWRVIQGGSRSYIPALTAKFKDKIRLSRPVAKVVRHADYIQIGDEKFDQVILACHSDQALRMLSQPTESEIKILGAFSYQPNQTTLHYDQRVLPRSRRAWAAWNYWVPRQARSTVAVTYDMNILQGIASPERFCVSLNMDDVIDPAQVLARLTYHHPVYTSQSVRAQGQWAEISGNNRTHFCGAYWGFGFHEDGVKSALQVAQTFGESL